MNCPHCGKKINMKDYFKELGSKGGSKSRRTLTHEQSMAMVEARRAKKAGHAHIKNNTPKE